MKAIIVDKEEEMADGEDNEWLGDKRGYNWTMEGERGQG